MTTTTHNPDWKSALAKQAAPQEAPKDEVAEAFAAQAYTAIENRASALMTDPHLLGFEIIDRNEGNNRLIGAFAFRVGQELLLAVVFFLNGTVKGQQLLYRKTKDMFVPNNKTQIKAIMADAEALGEGEGVPRNAAHGATMEFDTRALAAPMRKFASEDRDEIMGAWKSACDAALNHEKVATRHIFGQFLCDHPDFREKAASLIERDEEFAEAVVISRAIEQSVMTKEAAAPQVPALVLHTRFPDSHEKLASLQGSLYKRGYAIEDNRPPEAVFEAMQEGNSKETVRTSPHLGLDHALDLNGDPVKVLVAPVGNRPRRELIVLEGKDKGLTKSISSSRCEWDPGRAVTGDNCVFTDDKPFHDVSEALGEVGDAKPKSGKHYFAYLPGCGKFFGGGKLHVDKVSTSGDITEVKLKHGRTIILRKDIEETHSEDASWSGNQTPVFGSDARWVEVKDKWDEPSLMEAGRLFDFMANKSRGKVRMGKRAGDEIFMQANGRTRVYPCESQASMKLASLGIGADSACDIVDRVMAGETLEFRIVPSLEKLAHVWYEREPDAENDFVSTGYDSDFGIPVDDMSGIMRHYPAHRSARTQEASRYLDAAVPVGSSASPDDHIPDEVLLQMTNPAQQLSQIAANSGMDHMIDHGALGSLVKTFDAVSLASSYIADLEKGIDRLGRIVFLVLWKPADFAEKFGDNDMPHLENSLISAFEKHGDLVLELRQFAGND